MSDLLHLLDHIVRTLAPEAEAAGRWADCYLAEPRRRERARRMLGELSERIVASGSPRDFVAELPGVGAGLPPEAAYLVFRMVKTNLYVAAAYGSPLTDPVALRDQNLLLLGASWGLESFLAALSERGPAGTVLRRHLSLEDAAARLETELARRVAPVAGTDPAASLRGTLEFLAVASAADVANAYYDDGLVSPQEMADLVRSAARRTVSVLGLVKLVAGADDSTTPEELALLADLRRLLPGPDPTARHEALATLSAQQLPAVLSLAEERQGLLACMVAMAAADGMLQPAEEGLCRDVARLLEISEVDTDRILAGWRTRSS